MNRLSSGNFLPGKNRKAGPYPVYGGNGVTGYHDEYFVNEPVVVIGRVGVYCGCVHVTQPKAWITDNALYVTECAKPVSLGYLGLALEGLCLNRLAKQGAQPSVSQSAILEEEICFPNKEIQDAIVKALEAERALVESNRKLMEIFEAKIKARLDEIWGSA